MKRVRRGQERLVATNCGSAAGCGVAALASGLAHGASCRWHVAVGLFQSLLDCSSCSCSCLAIVIGGVSPLSLEVSSIHAGFPSVGSRPRTVRMLVDHVPSRCWLVCVLVPPVCGGNHVLLVCVLVPSVVVDQCVCVSRA
eukprot:4093308-Prymnesium_polylepis.1